jgi:uncharacterized protein (DUF1778 family)
MPPEEQRQEARIEVRCSTFDKSIIEEAALTLGINLSAFVKSQLLKIAYEIIKVSQVTSLSDKDSERFFEIIEDDSPPPPALLNAAIRYTNIKASLRES